MKRLNDNIRALALLLGILPMGSSLAAESAVQTNAYFGAVHVHTYYSFDAYTNGTLASPAQAYQWAQGKAIPGGGGGPDLKIRQPLDFYAVSDHAEWLGVFKLMEDPDSPLSKHPIAPDITSDDRPQYHHAGLRQILARIQRGQARCRPR